MGLLTLHASALQDFQHTVRACYFSVTSLQKHAYSGVRLEVDVGKLIEIREDPGDVLTKEYLDSTLGSKY